MASIYWLEAPDRNCWLQNARPQTSSKPSSSLECQWGDRPLKMSYEAAVQTWNELLFEGYDCRVLTNSEVKQLLDKGELPQPSAYENTRFANGEVLRELCPRAVFNRSTKAC